MYETQTPSARSGHSLEEYQERGGMRFNLGLVGPTATQVAAEPAQTCSCSRFERPYPMIRCDVLVRQVQEDASGKQFAEVHHDLWEYADGEWFYVVSSIGARCAVTRAGRGEFDVNGRQTCGCYYQLSADLIHWGHPQLIVAVQFPWCTSDPQDHDLLESVYVGGPALSDHGVVTTNFERAGRTPHLYHMRFNDQGLDRDLMRVPLTFTRTN